MAIELSPFDAISVRPTPKGGYHSVIYSAHPHEIAHVKEVVRAHRMKVRLRAWSLLASFHESLGMPPAQKMRTHPKAIPEFESQVHTTKFSEAIAALVRIEPRNQHNSIEFALRRTRFLELLRRAIVTQFRSRQAFLRAFMQLEKDPVAGKVYRGLNRYHQDNLTNPKARRDIIQLIHFLSRQAKQLTAKSASSSKKSKP